MKAKGSKSRKVSDYENTKISFDEYKTLEKKLELFINSYMELQKKISGRKKEWKEKGREVVFRTLKNIEEQFHLNWSAQLVENNGREFICLSFSHLPTELLEEGKIVNIMGSKLCYSQLINGKICVNMCFPYFKNANLSEIKHEKLDIIEPEKIESNLVYKHVAIFIDKLKNWYEDLEM